MEPRPLLVNLHGACRLLLVLKFADEQSCPLSCWVKPRDTDQTAIQTLEASIIHKVVLNRSFFAPMVLVKSRRKIS